MNMDEFDRLPKSVRERLANALGNRDLAVVQRWRDVGMHARDVVKRIEAWDRADNAGIVRAGLMPPLTSKQPVQLVPKRNRARQRRYLP
jgi:hypothetical protein